MDSTISTAARQYANRPKDERFGSVADLVESAREDKRLSAECTYSLRDLSVMPDPLREVPGSVDHGIVLQSPKGLATFTHWSFGQLCRMVGAPASYVRDLPPALGADCLNHGLHESAASGSDAVLLVKSNGCDPVVRAVNSDSYGRVWDAPLYGEIKNLIMDQDSSWTLPPTWTGEPAGAYRGDRDSFLILTNGGSIVADPSISSADGHMYRGLLVRNSEVGASSVVIEAILYRYVCGNHMLWGAMVDRSFRRRHVGARALRDTIREIGRIAISWSNRSASSDEAIVRSLIDHEIAHTQAAVVDELRKMGATRDQAETAFIRCEQQETASPRSFWGVAQGLTRLSQDAPYQDERYQLDRLAAQVLQRGAKLVRV
jgi:hypothetical protein